MGGRMRGASRGEGKTERRGDRPEEGGEPGKAREAVQKGATRTSAGNARDREAAAEVLSGQVNQNFFFLKALAQSYRLGVRCGRASYRAGAKCCSTVMPAVR